MGSYRRVDEDLDEYEDDFIDDQDGDGAGPSRYGAGAGPSRYGAGAGPSRYGAGAGPSRYGAGAGPSRYADDEEDDEEEEVEEEPVSEEALKLLKYRQKIKEQIRSKMRQEDGGSSRGQVRSSNNLGNFGSFFGSSQPTIADRVLQQSKALLETRHLARKASSSQSNGKKASMPPFSGPSSSGTKNGVSRPPTASQVKSKAQTIKQTRDYSFLLSDDADAPKPAIYPGQQKSSRDPGQQKSSRDPRQQKSFAQKLDARPAQVPTKSNGPPAQSGRKAVNGYEQRKPFGSPQVCSTRTAPFQKLTPENRASVVPSDSRKQLDLRKQPQVTKQMVSGTGNGSARPPIARALPPKRPSSSSDKHMFSGSAEKKLPLSSASNRAPPLQKHSAPYGQRVPAEKQRASGVTKPLEHRRNGQQNSDNRVHRRDNMKASEVEVKPPMRSSLQSNLDRNHSRVQKPHGKPSANNQSSAVRKVSNIKKRKAEEDDDLDYLSEIRRMFRYNPSRYRDDDDDDDCMEVGFDTIRQEEIRSARIAKKEDDEELEKIMEEERQERLRKKAKMRKMSQR